MLKYLKNSNGKFTEVTASEVLAGNEPIGLFLGGLLHFNNLQIGSTLSKIIDKLTDAPNTGLPTYVVIRAGETNVGKSAGDMYAFENTGKISEEAEHLVNELILPPPVANQDPASVRQHLSRFNVIAYSYGTSLVQQAETLILESLKGKGHSLAEASQVMDGFAALNIGPVARPIIWTEEGLTSRFNRHSYPEAPTFRLFSQYFFLRRFDKISNDCVDDKLIHDLANDREIHLFGTPSSIYICDNTGDDRLRRIGFKALSSGCKFPHINYNMDHEGHDLRLYTNTLEYDDLTATYPSLGTAPYLVDACRHMVTESPKAIAGAKRDMTAPVICLQNSDTVRLIEQRIARLHQHFERVVNDYSLSNLKHGSSLIETELEDVKKMVEKEAIPENLRLRLPA